MNKKRSNFKKIIKENKKLLEDNGIKTAALNGYIYTDRVPMESQAKKIAGILGVPLAEIPYYRVEHV